MTITELKKIHAGRIEALDLDLILEDALQKPRSFILAHPEKPITNYELRITHKKIKRRIKGEPLAYVLGHKEFYGLAFEVNRHVLVPRPETEMLVAEALRLWTPDAYLVDVGTGSGCILVSLAKAIGCGSNKRHRFIGIDISAPALKIAHRNAKNLGVSKKIKFLKGNLLEPILKSPILNLRSSIIITANLPYLTPTQIKNSPTIQSEPRLALEAGRDGLKYYRQLLQQLKTIHRSQFLSTHSAACPRLSALLEIDPAQTKKFKALAAKILPSFFIIIKKDLSGQDRLAMIGTVAKPCCE